jgi:hypothetical protein
MAGPKAKGPIALFGLQMELCALFFEFWTLIFGPSDFVVLLQIPKTKDPKPKNTKHQVQRTKLNLLQS